MSEIISSEEMNNHKIYEIFKAAYMKPELDSDGDVSFKGPSGFKQIISVDSDKQLLKFMAIFGLKESKNRAEKLELVNRLNDRVVFSRFSMPREDVLFVDYFFAYEEGVLPLQVMNSMKWFDNVTISAIRAYDESDLID